MDSSTKAAIEYVFWKGSDICLFAAVFLGPGTVPGTECSQYTFVGGGGSEALPWGRGVQPPLLRAIPQNTFSLGSQAAEIFPTSSFSEKWLMSLIMFVSIVPLLFSGRLSHTLNISNHFLS